MHNDKAPDLCVHYVNINPSDFYPNTMDYIFVNIIYLLYFVSVHCNNYILGRMNV